MLKFRKEINKLKMHCLETATLSGDKIYFCETHGVNSLIPAYMAHGTVNEAYEQIEDAAEMHPEGRMRVHAEKLNELFANIKPNDLNNPALFAEKCKIDIFGRSEKGWEKDFGDFHWLSEWKKSHLTVNTLPFEVEDENAINIGYSSGNISR